MDELDPTQPCDICDGLIHAHIGFRKLDVQKMIHSSFRCRPCTRSTKLQKDLCTLCKHMGLRHLLICCRHLFEEAWNSAPGLELTLGLRLGSWDELRSRTKCSLCELLAQCSIRLITAESDYVSDLPSCEILLHIETKMTAAAYQNQLHLRVRSLYDQQGFNIGLIRYSAITLQSKARQWIRRLPWGNIRFPSSRKLIAPSTTTSIGPFIDWERIRTMLHHCLLNHQACSVKDSKLPPQSFRLIDVQQRKLTYMEPHVSYVALSYLWGFHPSGEFLQALHSNIAELEHEGSLIRERLPATIHDAMEACKRLGQRYLWVDRLCILQDESDDKLLYINSMDAIYASAFLVLVVTDGDMHAGIPGISRERPRWKESESVCSMKLEVERPGFRNEIGISPWNCRGWTYQEGMLAKRKLYMTPYQSFYTCKVSIRSEDPSTVDLDPQAIHALSHSSVLKSLDESHGDLYTEQTFIDFTNHAFRYTFRHLTNPSDILNAFTGVSQALWNNEENFLYGLPRTYFDQALLWHPFAFKGAIPKWRESKKQYWPTWAWCSIDNIYGCTMEYGITCCGPLVRWSMVNAASETSTMEDVKEWHGPEEWRKSADWPSQYPQLCMALALASGCFESDCSPGLGNEQTFPELASLFNSRFPSPQSFFHWITFQHHLGSQFPTYLQDSLNGPWVGENYAQFESEGALIGNAQVASLRLEMHQTNSMGYGYLGDFVSHDILDSHGSRIGLIRGGAPAGEISKAHAGSGETLEFLALSISGDAVDQGVFRLYQEEIPEFLRIRGEESMQHSWTLCQEFEEELIKKRKLGLTYFDRDGTALYPPPVVNVLLIGRRGPYAYRIAIGWVLLTKWVAAKPHFETIFLR